MQSSEIRVDPRLRCASDLLGRSLSESHSARDCRKSTVPNRRGSSPTHQRLLSNSGAEGNQLCGTRYSPNNLPCLRDEHWLPEPRGSTRLTQSTLSFCPCGQQREEKATPSQSRAAEEFYELPSDPRAPGEDFRLPGDTPPVCMQRGNPQTRPGKLPSR